jgi:hypothetical protein
MTTFSKLTIAAVVLVSHAAAGPTTFPPLKSGAGVRVFALSGERCVGKVLAWRPVEMTIELGEPTACGAVDGVLRITPDDVQKVDTNLHPFWHAVTRPAAWLWTGVEVVGYCAYAGGYVLWALVHRAVVRYQPCPSTFSLSL